MHTQIQWSTVRYVPHRLLLGVRKELHRRCTWIAKLAKCRFIKRMPDYQWCSPGLEMDLQLKFAVNHCMAEVRS